MLESLVAIAAVIAMATASAFLGHRGNFSVNTFLIAIAIGILVLAWQELLPIYSIVLSVMIMAGMLFMGSKTDGATIE